MSKHSFRWVIVALAVVLSACTQGPGEPSPTSGVTTSALPSGPVPTRSTTATSTSGASQSAAPTPTGVPVAAQADTADGSVAFVRFVVAEVNRAYQTADVTILPPLISPECRGCVALTEDLADTATKKMRASADIWTAKSVMINAWEPGRGSLTLRIDQNKVDYLDEMGRRVDTADAGSYEYILTLERTQQGWRVVRWQKVVP